MPDQPVDRIDLYVVGPRPGNFPHGKLTIPAALLRDYEKLLAECRVTYPHTSHESLLRYIFLKGLDGLRERMRRGNAPPDPDKIPAPTK